MILMQSVQTIASLSPALGAVILPITAQFALLGYATCVCVCKRLSVSFLSERRCFYTCMCDCLSECQYSVFYCSYEGVSFFIVDLCSLGRAYVLMSPCVHRIFHIDTLSELLFSFLAFLG